MKQATCSHKITYNIKFMEKRFKMRHNYFSIFVAMASFFVFPACVSGQDGSVSLVNETVYINNIDTKFHREFCEKLVLGKRSILVKDALLKKYKPCDICGASIRYKNSELDISEKSDQSKFINLDPVQLRSDIPEYCPNRYFANPLPEFFDFSSLKMLIQKYGKHTVFNVDFKLSKSVVTVRVGDEFREFVGPPDLKYVDDCTIMYDFINLRLSAEEAEKHILAFKADDEKKKEAKRLEERRIAEEKHKEALRRIEEEKKLQEKKDEDLAKSNKRYNSSKDYNYDPNPYARPCRDGCSMYFTPGTIDYNICVSSCASE